MTFDEWMADQNQKYEVSDDTVMLRLLRRCWDEAINQKLETIKILANDL